MSAALPVAAVNPEKYKQIMGFFVEAGKTLPRYVGLQLASLKDVDFKEFLRELAMSNKSAPKMYAASMGYFFKSFEWLPSLKEFILFALFIAIIYIIVEIIHNIYINNKVAQQSRCIRAKHTDENKVTVTDGNGNVLYSVKYDPATRAAATIKCENDGMGTNANTYNVKTYDYQTNTPKTIQQQCQKQQFTATGGTDTTTNGSLFYSGAPGLIDFMTTNNTAYFNP
jgi:hypothetical protein